MAKYSIDQVIDAGIRAYAKFGEDFTMSNVADELGTRPSSLYRHIPNKRELYFAMVTREFNRFNMRIEEFASDNPQGDVMRFVGSMILKIGREDFGLFKLMFVSRPPPAPTDYSPGHFELQCNPRTIHNLLGIVRRLGIDEDPVLLTYTLMSLVLGGSILTSEVYSSLNEGILPKERYSEFHEYLLGMVGRLLENMGE